MQLQGLRLTYRKMDVYMAVCSCASSRPDVSEARHTAEAAVRVPSRLDFNDLEIDAKGRALAAFADGCITADCRAGVDRSGPNDVADGKVDSYDNDGEDIATIIRQSSGRTLFAQFDLADAPSNLWAAPAKAKVMLNWTDNSSN